MPFLSAGNILPIKFIYQIAGVIEGPSKQFKDEYLDHGLTVNLGGDILAGHSSLMFPFSWNYIEFTRPSGWANTKQ